MKKELDVYGFYLVAFTSNGYCCEKVLYPNKTQAISQGRFLKREGYAFSYKVYKQVKGKPLKLIAKG